MVIALGFAAALAAALALQALIPPVIGLADNSDFSRLMLDFGLQHRSEVYHDRYFDYFNRLYVYRPETAEPSGYLTSSKLLVWAAVQLHRLFTSESSFDLRWLGLLNALVYWAGGALLLIGIARHCQHSRQKSSLVHQLVLSALTLVILADVAQVQFMNSFYTEPAAILALVWLAACSVLLSSPAQRSASAGLETGFLLIAYLLAAVVFVTAKPQFAPLGLLLGLWAFRLIDQKRFWIIFTPPGWGMKKIHRTVLGAVALFIIVSASLFSLLAATPPTLKGMTSFNLIFVELLTKSPDPLGDLEALGFSQPARLAGFAGYYHWDHRVQEALQAQPELLADISKIDHLDVLLFYLTHPQRLARLLTDATTLAFDTHLNRYGNFEKETGFVAYAQSRRFNLWSRLHQEVIPHSTLFFALFFLGSAAACLYARRRLYKSLPASLFPETHLFLLLLALAGIGVVVFGEGSVDANRHLIVFNLTCDLSLLFLVDYAFVLRRRNVDDQKIIPQSK